MNGTVLGVETEFRLLGDLEVRIGGVAADIGHARQRCVLAALLIDTGHLVGADQLLERVWADRQPRHARNALSGYVSRLRAVLAPAGAAIERTPGGYLLTIDPETLDLQRFRDLAGKGRAAGDEDLLDEALGLWRGDAFGSLDTPWISDTRAALEAERRAVELDRNDLALARGGHAELVTGLAASARQDSQDERLAGQLMLALYRCGRQSEALRHYELLRRGLADELGADPTPALRELHRRILANDPALSPAPAGPPVPRQLPAPPRLFTGRVRELAMLDTAFPVVAVSGTAGVGKTALAVHWAHSATERFPDGQLYVNLRGFGPGSNAMDPAEAIRGFLDALGIPAQRIPVDPDAQAGLYRSLLANRRMLILMDNARDADQVTPLLPGTAGCVVVVTSRDRLTGLIATAGAQPLILDLLSPAEARDLLVIALGAERVAAEPGAVDDVVKRCACLPLALAIVAARAAAHPDFPLEALAAELSKAEGGLDALDGGDLASDARAVFSWSTLALSPSAERIFRLIGLHPGPDLTASAAASLAGLRVHRARPLLAELTRAHLLDEDTPGRYSLHDLLRLYANEQVLTHESEQERLAALHRGLDYYLHSAHACAVQLNPYRDPIAIDEPMPGMTAERPADYAEALAWFAAEHHVLLCAALTAARTGLDGHVWRLAWTMWTFLDRQGHWRDLMTIGRQGLSAAHRLGDIAGQAVTHRILARATQQSGRLRRAHAHLRHALELYKRLDDVAGQAHTHNKIASVWEARGRYVEALDHAWRSFELYRATGNRRGQAQAFNSVGWLHALLGDHEQAVSDCREALATLQELEDHAGEAVTWDSLGYAHHHLGHHTRAVACYRRAIEKYVRLGDRYEEATTLTRLGDTHAAAGSDAAARHTWTVALSILDDLGHPDAGGVRERLAKAEAEPGVLKAG